MVGILFALNVVFYRSGAGNEPVRDWLKELSRDDKRKIGENIKTVQLGWPLGIPLIRKIDRGFVGGPNSFATRHCASLVHCLRRSHDFVAWFYQKVAKDPGKRTQDSVDTSQ